MESKEWVETDTGHPGEVMEAGQRAGWTRWEEMDQFKV